jgi:hypothetical protein
MTTSAADLSSVVRRVGSLFERAYATGAERPTWAEIEDLLTEGYAHALGLEGERAQIEKRISSLISASHERDTAIELRALSARHSEIDRNVRWLRSLLAELREYGSGIKER